MQLSRELGLESGGDLDGDYGVDFGGYFNEEQGGERVAGWTKSCTDTTAIYQAYNTHATCGIQASPDTGYRMNHSRGYQLASYYNVLENGERLVGRIGVSRAASMQ